MAPPLTLLLAGSSPRALATARYCGAKASFTCAEQTTSVTQLCNNDQKKVHGVECRSVALWEHQGKLCLWPLGVGSQTMAVIKAVLRK